MIRVAIIGATGYTGSESIEILLRHPLAKATYLTASSNTTTPLESVHPGLKGRCELDIEPLNFDKLAETADVALCCLPHKVSMEFVPQMLNRGVKVIDFSADYRIKDISTYEKYYVEHTDPENVKIASYGLPELYRKEIVGSTLVANPGCFPTSCSLGLAPLLKKNLIKADCIVVNSVSGASGAGKKLNDGLHYPNMNENLRPYSIGTHRHIPEMEQVASDMCNGTKTNILFQPHIGPFDRGILSSIYCDPAIKITEAELVELYNEFYKDEPFVQICSEPPAVKNVAFTNYCHIMPRFVKGKVVVFAAIDNLVKGASGQAIQNMNLLFGLDETMGLN